MWAGPVRSGPQLLLNPEPDRVSRIRFTQFGEPVRTSSDILYRTVERVDPNKTRSHVLYTRHRKQTHPPHFPLTISPNDNYDEDLATDVRRMQGLLWATPAPHYRSITNLDLRVCPATTLKWLYMSGHHLGLHSFLP